MFFSRNNGLCDCECHKKGVSVRHCMPCCELTYVQYINKDGSIDNEVIKQHNEMFGEEYGTTGTDTKTENN